MIHLLTVLLLALHLLAMNVASAGPLVGVWLARNGRREGLAWQLGLRLVWLSLGALMVGALVGGAMLLLPSAGVRAALGRFPAETYWYALVELVFSAALMGTVGALLHLARPRGWLAATLALVSATNLLYHFPPLMAVFGELGADPAWAAAEVIDHQTLLALCKRPEILALWAHFVAASFAVAAMAAVWPSVDVKDSAEDDSLAKISTRVALVALTATLMQLPIGVCLLATDRPSAREAMLGQNLAASVCFGASLLLAFALLQALGSMAFGEGPRAAPRAGWLMIAVVTLMAGTLRTSRDAKTIRGGDLTSPPRSGPLNSMTAEGAQKTLATSPTLIAGASRVAKVARPR